MGHVFRRALAVSRPHLWTYSLGAAVLGALGAAGNSAALIVRGDGLALIGLGLWLTVPAGWLFNGINDVCDRAADAQNPRKRGVERAAPFGTGTMLSLAAVGAALYLPLVFALPAAVAAALGLALAASLAYNVPPLRLKARPFLDAAVCLIPVSFAVAGYAAVAGVWPPALPLAIALAFSLAMHLYSAAADFEADRASGLLTVAVWLGSPGRAVSLAARLALAVAVAAAALGGSSWGFAAAAYAAFFAAHRRALGRPDFDARRWYGAFAALHFIVGTGLTAASF